MDCTEIERFVSFSLRFALLQSHYTAHTASAFLVSFEIFSCCCSDDSTLISKTNDRQTEKINAGGILYISIKCCCVRYLKEYLLDKQNIKNDAQYFLWPLVLAEIIIFSNFPRPTNRKWHRKRICMRKKSILFIHNPSSQQCLQWSYVTRVGKAHTFIHTSFIAMCLAHISTSCDLYSFTLHKFSELQSSALSAPMQLAPGPTTLALFWKIRTKYSDTCTYTFRPVHS